MARIDPERRRELEPLLDRVLELTVEERATWLDELRVQSPALADDFASVLVVK